MNKWITLLGLAFLSLSYSPSVDLELKRNLASSKNELDCVYQELEVLKAEVQCYEDLLINNHNRKSNYKKSSFKKNYSILTNTNYNHVFYLCKRVNMNIANKMKEALDNCTFGGNCLITSGLRSHCKKSLHSKGLAVDLNWDDNGRAFASFLETPEGILWMSNHNIDYYLENISSKKKHPKYFYNPNATGPHIHMFIKK